MLDSSVLVSGFLTEGGTTATLLSRYRQRRVRFVQFALDIGETERALLRPRNMNRYRYRPEDVRQFLGGLARSAQFFRDAPQIPAVTRDPSDDQGDCLCGAARAEYSSRDDDMLVLSSARAFELSRRGSFSTFSTLRAPVSNGR